MSMSQDANSVDGTAVLRQSDFGDRICVLRWTRNPREFEEALNKHAGLEPVRAAAEAAGHVCRHVSGASVFVYPNQYREVHGALAGMTSLELRPYHTVVNEAFKPLVMEAAQQLRSKANVRLRGEQVMALVASGSSEDSHEVLVVEDTFFKLIRSSTLLSSASMVQSDPLRGMTRNPRACEVAEDP